jgi:hypothetical protein
MAIPGACTASESQVVVVVVVVVLFIFLLLFFFLGIVILVLLFVVGLDGGGLLLSCGDPACGSGWCGRSGGALVVVLRRIVVVRVVDDKVFEPAELPARRSPCCGTATVVSVVRVDVRVVC